MCNNLIKNKFSEDKIRKQNIFIEKLTRRIKKTKKQIKLSSNAPEIHTTKRIHTYRYKKKAHPTVTCTSL